MLATLRRLVLICALLCGAFALSGCGQPADDAVKEFIGVTDKHAATVEAGTWDKAAFDADMKPVLDKLKELRKSNPGLPISQAVDDELKASNTKFLDACTRKKNAEAQDAMGRALFDMAGRND